MEKKQLRKAAVAAALITAALLLPFLGLTDFTTKGEPREAVVALSMIDQHNWILPVNNGGDIPYKPPFFHFCIALLSPLTGGVNEYSSRLPSALALIGMVVGCFVFYARRRGMGQAFLAVALTLTAFEVHRAGTVCRVDMVLTAFVVGALLLFCRWWERGSRGVPLLAVLCMSGAVLTKGPVGFVLPCLVMVVFTLLRGGRVLPTVARYAAFALMSCILPAVWYWAAWRQGGDGFLQLVYEENIGRMTGTMSYESHAHPFTYNFVTMISGWAPWTLLCLMSLFTLPWKRLFARRNGGCSATEKGSCLRRFAANALAKARSCDSVWLFTWLSAVLIFVFYCLPSSKRSVYLLPCYPFVAVLLARYMVWLWQSRRRWPGVAFIITVAVLALVAALTFAAVGLGLVPDTIFHGRHAAQNAAMLHSMHDAACTFGPCVAVLLSAVSALCALMAVSRRRLRDNTLIMLSAMCVPVLMLMMALDAAYQPAVMNAKSLRPMASYIEKNFAHEKLYSYIDAPMMHFFGANFYLGDRIKDFEPSRQAHNNSATPTKDVCRTPLKGVLIVPENDFEKLASRHADYRFKRVAVLRGRVSEVKGDVGFYQFEYAGEADKQ